MFNRRVEIFGAIKTQTRVNGEPKKVWKGISLKSKQENEQRDTENLQINRKNRELRIQERKDVPKATTFSNYYLKDETLIAFASMLQREESELAKEESLSQFTILESGLYQCGFCPAYRTTDATIKEHIMEDHVLKLTVS